MSDRNNGLLNDVLIVGNELSGKLNEIGISNTFGRASEGKDDLISLIRMAIDGIDMAVDTNSYISLTATNPYMLTGETTDIVAKLRNGVCRPLKNKNISIGQSVFIDYGTTNNYSNWDNVTSTMQMTRQDTYTELKMKTGASSFGYIVKDLSVTDGITIEFDFKQATIPSSNDQYLSFRDSSGNTKLGVSRNYQSLNDGEWHHYKLVVNGLTVTPVIDGVQKSNLTLSDSWSRIQLEARNNAVHHFKNFVIYNNSNHVTNENGEFVLHDVSVTDDTIFNASYGTVNSSEVTVYPCIYRDYATSNNNSNIWYTNNATITREATYTSIKNIESRWGSIYLGNPSTKTPINLLENNNGIIIELQAHNVFEKGTKGFNVRWNDGTNHYISFQSGIGHHKMVLSKTRVDIYLDDVWKEGYDLNISNAYLQSVSNTNDVDIQFYDLRIRAF